VSRFQFIIGTDEAGYGPNLGPLVVAASVWQIPHKADPYSLYELLKATVSAEIPADGDPRLAMADSKQLYKPGCGLRHLERALHAVWAMLAREATTWRRVWPLAAGSGLAWLDELPWHAGYDLPLPCDIALAEIAAAAQFFERGIRKVEVALVDVQADLLFPARFNDLVDRYDSKGEVLSLTTLALVARQIESLPAGNVTVLCDKHGGRGRYAALLQHLFPEGLVEVRVEGRAESRYRVKLADRIADFCFAAQGERNLPTALASMLAKYLRELAMLPFNEFWQREVAGLKRTAGYPQDARRFWDDIAPARQRLQLDERSLWRSR
jgi:hypothetical protein